MWVCAHVGAMPQPQSEARTGIGGLAMLLPPFILCARSPPPFWQDASQIPGITPKALLYLFNHMSRTQRSVDKPAAEQAAVVAPAAPASKGSWTYPSVSFTTGSQD